MDPTVVDSLPEDRSYLEWDLPDDLVASIERLRASWKKKDAGERCTEWDLDYCELQSDINRLENEGAISPRQADHLRHEHLRYE